MEGTLGQEMHVKVEGTLAQEMHVGVKGDPAYWQLDRMQHVDHGYGWHELSSCLVVQYLLARLDLLIGLFQQKLGSYTVKAFHCLKYS